MKPKIPYKFKLMLFLESVKPCNNLTSQFAKKLKTYFSNYVIEILMTDGPVYGRDFNCGYPTQYLPAQS